jgi:hypothetical protein
MPSRPLEGNRCHSALLTALLEYSEVKFDCQDRRATVRRDHCKP